MFGQTEPVTVPSKKNFSLHVSSAQPRHYGSRYLSLYTSVQWALTFPNLRRHTQCAFICTLTVKIQANVQMIAHNVTSRFVPVAKEFL